MTAVAVPATCTAAAAACLRQHIGTRLQGVLGCNHQLQARATHASCLTLAVWQHDAAAGGGLTVTVLPICAANAAHAVKPAATIQQCCATATANTAIASIAAAAAATT